MGMTKDCGLRIRVQRDLRDKFLEVCRTQDKPAAQVIREFMRDYVEHHGRSAGLAVRRAPAARANTKDDA
jgi:hypothetical protein